MAEQQQPDINQLSGDMEAMLDEFGNLEEDGSGNEEVVYISGDADIVQEEPNAKDFLLILYSQSPNDSVRNHFGRSYQAAHDVSDTGRTKFFYCLELVVPLLYWYNAFHGIMTDKVQLICPCYLESGLILVALWRTRCNSPVIHAIMLNVTSGFCFMSKDGCTKFRADPEKIVDSNLFETVFRFLY